METVEKLQGGTLPLGRECLCNDLRYFEEEKVKAVTPLEKELAVWVQKEKAAAAALAAIAEERAKVQLELHAKKINFSTKIGPIKRQLSANPPESATRMIKELQGLMGDYGKKIETSSKYFPGPDRTTIWSSGPNVRAAQGCLQEAIRKIFELVLMPFFGEEFEGHLSRIKKTAIDEAEKILARPPVETQRLGQWSQNSY